MNAHNAIYAMNASNALYFTRITRPPVIFCSSWGVSLKRACGVPAAAQISE